MLTDSDHYIASQLKVELVNDADGTIARQTIAEPRTSWAWGYERKEDWRRNDNDQIGEGGGGTVYLERCGEGKLMKQRAVKVFKGIKACDYKREIEAAMVFSHAKYRDSFVESYGWYQVGESICLTMEYLPCGSLRSVHKPIPEDEGSHIIRQVLQALEHMHAHNFIHRDIKPANILVQQPGPDWWIKIADFGISKRAKLDNGVYDTGWYSRGYEAPEQRGLTSEICSHTTDIFATGLVAYLILTGRLPFPEDEPHSLVEYCEGRNNKAQAYLRTKVSLDGHQFIMMLLEPKPTGRPDATACLGHSWVKVSRPTQNLHAVQEVVPTTLQDTEKAETATQGTSLWNTFRSLNWTGLLSAQESTVQTTTDTVPEVTKDEPSKPARMLSNASKASNEWTDDSTAPDRVQSLAVVAEEPYEPSFRGSPSSSYAPRFSVQIGDSIRPSCIHPEEKILVSSINDHTRDASEDGTPGTQPFSTPLRQTHSNWSQQRSEMRSVSADSAFTVPSNAECTRISHHSRVSQYHDSGYHSSSSPHRSSRLSTDSYSWSQTPPSGTPPSIRYGYDAMSDHGAHFTSSPRASMDGSTPEYAPRAAHRVRSMASVSSECSSFSWDRETTVGQCDHRVIALALSKTGKYGASWSQDGILKVWDPRNGQSRGDSSIKDVTSLLFSPNGAVLAVKAKYTLKLFKMEGWPFMQIRRIRIDSKHPNEHAFASECVFSKDSQRIAVVLEGMSGIVLVNTEHGTVFRRINTPRCSVTSIAVSPDLRTFAGSLNDNTVRIWNWFDGLENRVLRHGASPSTDVTRVAYNDHGWVAASSKSGVLKIWDHGDYTVETKSQDCELLDCAFCPNTDLIVTADNLGYVRFFHAADGSPYGDNLVKHYEPGPVLRVMISPDGLWGVSWGCSTLEVWSTATAHVLFRHTIGFEGTKACFGSPPNVLAVAIENGVKLFDLGSPGNRIPMHYT